MEAREGHPRNPGQAPWAWPCHLGPLLGPPRTARERMLLCSNNGRLWLANRPTQKALGVPQTAQPAAHYPPLSSLSSLHLLVQEFLVLEWGEKKTNAEIWIKFGERLF